MSPRAFNVTTCASQLTREGAKGGSANIWQNLIAECQNIDEREDETTKKNLINLMILIRKEKNRRDGSFYRPLVELVEAILVEDLNDTPSIQRKFITRLPYGS